PPIYSARTVSLCVPKSSLQEMISCPKALIHSYILFAQLTVFFYCFPLHCIYTLFVGFATCEEIRREAAVEMRKRCRRPSSSSLSPSPMQRHSKSGCSSLLLLREADDEDEKKHEGQHGNEQQE